MSAKRVLTDHEINKGVTEMYERSGIKIGLSSSAMQLDSYEYDKKSAGESFKNCEDLIVDAVKKVMLSDLCTDCKNKMAEIVRETAVKAFGYGACHGRHNMSEKAKQ